MLEVVQAYSLFVVWKPVGREAKERKRRLILIPVNSLPQPTLQPGAALPMPCEPIQTERGGASALSLLTQTPFTGVELDHSIDENIGEIPLGQRPSLISFLIRSKDYSLFGYHRQK